MPSGKCHAAPEIGGVEHGLHGKHQVEDDERAQDRGLAEQHVLEALRRLSAAGAVLGWPANGEAGRRGRRRRKCGSRGRRNAHTMTSTMTQKMSAVELDQVEQAPAGRSATASIR